jgi:hypothetical protein
MWAGDLVLICPLADQTCQKETPVASLKDQDIYNREVHQLGDLGVSSLFDVPSRYNEPIT